MKRILRDPGTWILLVTNLLIFIHYLNFPNSIHTIITLFWIQSVLIGLFNTLDIFTLTNITETDFRTEGPTDSNKINTGLLFIFLYALFHAAYVLFLTVLVIDIHQVDWSFVLFSFWFLLAGSVTGFIQNKLRNRTESANINSMFIMPYARILPMHLVVLIPAFLKVSAPMVFLIIKIFADLLMHVVYQRAIFKPMKTISN